MSRGVKDLRELICVSRLTIRDSDEEDELSFSDDDGRLSRALEELGIHSDTNGRILSANSSRGQLHLGSPDSGFGTSSNGVSPEYQSAVSVTRHGSASSFSSPKPPSISNKKKQRKKKSQPLPNTLSHGFIGHDLPKPEPLPPVSQKKIEPCQGEVRRKQTGNYDSMMVYCDQQCVYEWLREANVFKEELTTWCQCEDNFVCFASFWLNDFPPEQRLQMFQMEYSIILEHLEEAFVTGRRPGNVSRDDLEGLASVMLREYPVSLLGPKGGYMFLDYLDVLSSTHRHDAYKRLLSNVKCSTRISEHAQNILACRAFALLSLWSAVVNFYRTIHPEKARVKSLPSGYVSVSARRNNRAFQATRLGYTDVLQYMLTCRDVPADISDPQGHTLLFTAVSHSQIKTIHYLVQQFSADLGVNKIADNGNTALHAAANSGHIESMRELLKIKEIAVNPINPQCENATPLHLAVMHGHEEVVRILLSNGADVSLKMDDLSVCDLAREFARTDILQLLQPKT